MKNRELNFKFNNPNSVEDTADLLLKMFIEANRSNVDSAIRKAAEKETIQPIKCGTFD